MSGGLNGGGVADLQGSAEARRRENLVLAERAKEQALQTRVTALQLAATVTGGHADPKVTLRAAEAFRAFLTGEDPADPAPAH